MKYVSIDIETTGLDPLVNDIVEVGAVIDDLMEQAPVESLPTFHCYVVKDTYSTDAYCAFLHQAIFDRIARRKEASVAERYQFLTEREVMPRFVEWLLDNGFGKTVGDLRPLGVKDGRTDYVKVPIEKPRFVAAGKNFGSFDLQFLNKRLHFSEHVRCLHRSIDPAMLYFNPVQDTEPPNLQKCLDRAGVDETVDHTGLADALSVVKLIRAKYPKEG